MTETDPHGLTAPYAVDAVTDAERREAEDHLVGCPGCRAELIELAEALGELGAGAPERPPVALREAVMAGLDDVPQLPARPRVPAGVPGDVPAAVLVRRGEHVPAHRRHAGPVDDLAERRAARRRRVLPALSAAAAAVVLAGAALLGVTAVHYRSDRDAAQQAEIALGRVAAAPDAVTVGATTTDPRWSRTRLVVSRSRREAVLIPAGAGAAPSGRTWQLWFVSGTVIRSAGTFRAGGSDGAQVLTGTLGPASAVAVSLEPEGGSAQPTTTPVAKYVLPSA